VRTKRVKFIAGTLAIVILLLLIYVIYANASWKIIEVNSLGIHSVKVPQSVDVCIDPMTLYPDQTINFCDDFFVLFSLGVNDSYRHIMDKIDQGLHSIILCNQATLHWKVQYTEVGVLAYAVLPDGSRLYFMGSRRLTKKESLKIIKSIVPLFMNHNDSLPFEVVQHRTQPKPVNWPTSGHAANRPPWAFES